MQLLVSFIGIYQRWISPALPASCRFAPTCSDYARRSLEKYPDIKGIFLVMRRLARCHPYCEGGIDPVP